MKFPKKADDGAECGADLAVVSGQAETRSGAEIDHRLHEREIQRYMSCNWMTLLGFRGVGVHPKLHHILLYYASYSKLATPQMWGSPNANRTS